jgi:hypothetical protein
MEIPISDWTHKFQNKTGLDAKANSELYKSKRVNSADIFRKIRPSLILWEPLKATLPPRTAVGYLETTGQRRTQLCQRPLFTTYSTAVGNGAMNKFEICLLWRYEHLRPKCCYSLWASVLWTLRNIGNAAPRCWQLHDDACDNVEISANTPHFSYPYS